MAYYRVCPTCGLYLDPGEICEDCKKEEAAPSDTRERPQANSNIVKISDFLLPVKGGAKKMTEVPDAPWIQSCEATGYPEPPPDMPECPVCGCNCEIIYKNSEQHIVGCDCCITEYDASELE